MARLSFSELAALPPPAPWLDGDNIPWNEPDVSRRMLDEHLNSSHDAASRRPEMIDAHVEWVHREVLRGTLGRVLDLGCGPGLYTNRLARLGHKCVGIDYSPASVDYARKIATQEGLRCDYQCEDIRAADYGSGHALVMMISGELNVFRPEDARAILTRARESLAVDGVLLLEAHTEEAIRQKGTAGRLWYARQSSVFSDKPHIWLEERAWDVTTKTASIRYAVVDENTAGADVYGQTLQAYSPDSYLDLLNGCGLKDVSFIPSLRGGRDEQEGSFLVIVARSLARRR